MADMQKLNLKSFQGNKRKLKYIFLTTPEANMKTGTIFILLAFINMGLEVTWARKSPVKGRQRPDSVQRCPKVLRELVLKCAQEMIPVPGG